MAERKEWIGRVVYEAYNDALGYSTTMPCWDKCSDGFRAANAASGAAAIAAACEDVETIAKAVYAAVYRGDDQWDAVLPETRKYFDACARAAIRAIRGTRVLQRYRDEAVTLVEDGDGWAVLVAYLDSDGVLMPRKFPVSVEIPDEIEE